MRTLPLKGIIYHKNSILVYQNLCYLFNFDYDGGTLEVSDGLPEGADIPMFPEALQEFSPGLDTELKKMAVPR